MHDLIIIGGGPAGLSAALNGAAEGLDVLLLEASDRFGGQAGTSSRIENYLGFPDGVAGDPLTQAATKQAARLGASLLVNHAVTKLSHNEATGFWTTTCARGTEHLSRAVLVSVGVDYRRLTVPGGDSEHVLYGAPAAAHEECKDHDVVVIGGGNSAGQAALNLASVGARVTLLARRPLRATMSNYLIERVALHPGITPVLGNTERYDVDRGRFIITEKGDRFPASKVFAYIGTEPRADFVRGVCNTIEPGFIETDGNHQAHVAGLFVAGDIRQGSFKRVAAAVGEGAVAAAAAWRYIYNA